MAKRESTIAKRRREKAANKGTRESRLAARREKRTSGNVTAVRKAPVSAPSKSTNEFSSQQKIADKLLSDTNTSDGLPKYGDSIPKPPSLGGGSFDGAGASGGFDPTTGEKIKEFITNPVGDLPEGTQQGIAPAAGLKGFNIKTINGLNTIVTSPKTMRQIEKINKARKAIAASNKALQVGGAGLDSRSVGYLGTIAQNTKKTKTMTKWIASIATTLGLTMGGVVLYKDVVGTKVFTGFLGEETIQNLGFAYSTAVKDGNWADSALALDMEQELVTLMQSEEYIKGLPYDEAIEAASKFAEAAELTNTIRRKALQNLMIQAETGETDTEMYARIENERVADKEAERIADEEYYANVEAQKKAAKAADRAADEKYWSDISKQREKEAAKKRKEEQDYWFEVNKEIAKTRADSAPSKLNFGLL